VLLLRRLAQILEGLDKLVDRVVRDLLLGDRCQVLEALDFRQIDVEQLVVLLELR